MTANRWWVKSFARWQARLDASLQEINLGLRMISSGGIGSAALEYLGHGEWVAPFLAFLLGGIFVYAYLTFEGGVKGQVARDRQDMINNFSNPTMMIDDILIAVGVYTAVNGELPTESDVERIVAAVKEQWDEYREGVPEEWLDDN